MSKNRSYVVFFNTKKTRKDRGYMKIPPILYTLARLKWLFRALLHTYIHSTCFNFHVNIFACQPCFFSQSIVLSRNLRACYTVAIREPLRNSSSSHIWPGPNMLPTNFVVTMYACYCNLHKFITVPQLYLVYMFSGHCTHCLLYTSPSPRDRQKSRMPSSA